MYGRSFEAYKPRLVFTPVCTSVFIQAITSITPVMSVQYQTETASADTTTTMEQDLTQQPQPAVRSKKATKKRKRRANSEKLRVLARGKPAWSPPLQALLDLGGHLYPVGLNKTRTLYKMVPFHQLIRWEKVKVGDVVKWEGPRIIKGTLVKIGIVSELIPLMLADADTRHYYGDTVYDLDPYSYPVKKVIRACRILARSMPQRHAVRRCGSVPGRAAKARV
ncbi:Hypp3759 [Branchiostoma lanceolatum]|uniref:Hypp3759 protein n=1 Tax=Branchiostoma lanceolatum TaxID=7740 RepID=A0A8K0A238_BRALA|nr:Hypp3759 [Branchiostoma lanceolatum]